jgi:glutamyl-tRNA synthetase
LIEKGFSIEESKVTKIVSLIKERAHFVSEFWEMSDFFFVAPTNYDEKASKNWKAETPALMQINFCCGRNPIFIISKRL